MILLIFEENITYDLINFMIGIILTFQVNEMFILLLINGKLIKLEHHLGLSKFRILYLHLHSQYMLSILKYSRYIIGLHY